MEAAVVPILLTPTALMLFGLELLGHAKDRPARVQRKKNLGRFRGHYGFDPAVYSVLLHRLQTTDQEDARIDGYIKQVGGEKATAHFMMGIHLLACYPTEHEAESTFAKSFVAPCVETWSYWAWKFVGCICALKQEIITWPSKWNNPQNENSDEETIFIISIDGIHCPIEEPTLEDFSENKKFYSHKFNGPGLDCEIGISVFEQRCVWASGPCPAGENDVSVFRHKLKDKMKEARELNGVNFRGVADRGYRGERSLLSVPSSMDTDAVKVFKGRVLSRHENFNGRLKNFDCLEERFRHSTDEHKKCFFACAVIVQLQLENGSPLFVGKASDASLPEDVLPCDG